MTTIDYKPLTDAYKKVLKKEKLKEFYIHLAIYFVVNTVLFVTNIESNPAVFWGCFLGWGSGVISIFVFKIRPLDKQLEAQRIEVDRKKIEGLGRPAPSALRVHEYLQSKTILSVPSAADAIHLSAPTVRKSVGHLIDLGLVRETTGKQRDRLFVYSGYLDILNQGTEPL